MSAKQRIAHLIEYGFFSIIWTILGKINFEKRHKSIEKYLKRELKAVVQKYKHEGQPILSDAVKAERIIWVFWWDGEDKVPELVKACIQSIHNNSNDYQVVVLSQYNFEKYVTIPDGIMNHFKKGNFSIAHMSDILRIFLLSEHGGIWLDATIFLAEAMPISYLDNVFFSRKSDKYSDRFASKGRWTGYFMATSVKNSLLFDYLKAACISFWDKHKIIIDYFLLDYLILIAYNEFEPVRSSIDAIPVNNLNIKKLHEVLNKKFDKDEWSQMKEDTLLFKLSWKEKYNRTIDGEDTYYSMVVSSLD